ncbi:phosphatase PAP2 family protein [Clostridium brassicae]|uniref:Phosphatase PAP2 family protein n=1 Tax=Clostridium brassicae TaxID=2999072 RepID=A0ABT4D9V4_9CLOT|nr:phosphatase PAP2 family protein [Clostridium brassicae]MCY6959094.1 phosphatase PAP2 family protein [Clostridium brassicae]
MEKLKNNIMPLSFMISIPILNIFYGLLNNESRGAYSLVCSIDRATPFLKAFVLPYLIWYPYIFLVMVYICFKNKKVYYKILFCLDIGFIISYVIFYFFQTTVARPYPVEQDIMTKLIGIVYSNDKPFNCFPSLHVLTTYFVMKGISKVESNKKVTITVNIAGILIILSTLFIKQHVIMDVIFAIVLGGIILKTVNVVFDEGVEVWLKKLFLSLTMKKKLEN